MPCFYLTPEQDDSNQKLQICIAEALYDVDSIVADPEAYTKEQLASLHSQTESLRLPDGGMHCEMLAGISYARSCKVRQNTQRASR